MSSKLLLIITVIGICLVGRLCLAEETAQPISEVNETQAPTVSIIMSHYNNEQFIRRAVESILNQTYKDFEFLICDDGSTDNSLSIIKEYAAKDSRIKILENGENKGISYSRNRLYAIARGKYAAIMDSDDYSEPTRLEKQVAYMEAHPEITVVSSQAGYIGYELNVSFNNKPQETALNLVFWCSIADGSSMTRIDFVRQHNLKYDETILAGMDYKLWGDILANGGKFHTIPERLYNLRYHRSHKPAYYQDQRSVANQTSIKLQSLFFPWNEKTRHVSRCQKLKWIQESNKKLKLLDDEAIERQINQGCPATE